MDLKVEGFIADYPTVPEWVVSDRKRLFLQEYEWLRRKTPESLAIRVAYYPFMREQLIDQGWKSTYLDKIKISVIKEMWTTMVLKDSKQWGDRIAYWILLNSPEWADCFKQT
jgi:hypothetical protein